MPKGSASRAEALINKINKELKGIPDYKFGRPDGAPLVDPILEAITAARRGIRMLQGKDTTSELRRKRSELQDLVQEAKDLREMTFNLGKLSPEELKNVDEFSVMTGQSKAEYLKEKAKERMRKYGRK